MTTISISKSKHRLSPSLATLSLENFSQQQRSSLPSSNESTNASGIASVSPLVQRKRHSGELPMTTSSSSCNVKKTARRRARSTLGGGEDFVNGLDFAAGAPAGGASSQGSEENKPVLFFTSKAPGLHENGRVSSVQSTRVCPKASAAVPPPPAKEKQTSGMGKSGSAAGSVYHQSAKLERCLSERATTRIENRTIPLPDIDLPLDCPPLELVTHGRSPQYNPDRKSVV